MTTENSKDTATLSSPSVLVQIDPQADAAYLRFTGNRIASTRSFNDRILIDVDAAGQVVGVEVLGLSTEIPLEQIGRLFQMAPHPWQLVTLVPGPVPKEWVVEVFPDEDPEESQ